MKKSNFTIGEYPTPGIAMNEQLIFNKTRFAPTPSGFLHLGNIYSFAVTAALAEKTGAKILLRIDDFDREKTNKLYVQDIFDTLNFLGIPWHEGPRNMKEYEQEYSQVHRMGIYTNAVKQLTESGGLFACTCSRADILKHNPDSIYTGTCSDKNLPLDTENASWRILTSNTKQLEVKTVQGGIVNATLPAAMNDFIVRKKDGFPAYQLISILDDITFGIDLVVRGEDLWPSTVAQHYLASFIGDHIFTNTAFYHHPLLTDIEGHKLSKSEGATSVYHLRQQGKKPADIYELIARILHIDAIPANWDELISLLDLSEHPYFTAPI